MGPPAGLECTQNSDCDGGWVCIDASCYERCVLQMDCDTGMYCSVDGVCLEKTDQPPEPSVSAPAQVNAQRGDQQVTVAWEPVSGAVTYNLYWALEAGVTLDVNRVNGVTSPFVHAPLVNGSTYYYALTAVDELSESELSPEVSATPRISAPTQVSAKGGDQQATLTWEPVSGADTYNLYWAEAPGVTLDSSLVSDVTQPFVHSPLVNGITYYYALTAVDGLSESELSDEVSGFAVIDAGTKLLAPDAQARDYFGRSVAVSGDYAIVGAPLEDGGDSDPATDAGAAYVFRRTGTNAWDAGPKLNAPDAQAFDCFGTSVAVSGDYAIVGASGEDADYSGLSANVGAAYVFHYDGSSWDTGTKLVAPDAQDGDLFGTSVALSGNYAIVGAHEEDGGAGDPVQWAGAAYVFHFDGSSWDAGTKLKAPDAQARGFFGVSVALSDDYAIVGAHGEHGDYGEWAMSGAAYVFRRTSTSAWDSGTKLVAPDAQANDHFGVSVALSGDCAIVGAQDAHGRAGAAYVFRRTSTNAWCCRPDCLTAA